MGNVILVPVDPPPAPRSAAFSLHVPDPLDSKEKYDAAHAEEARIQALVRMCASCSTKPGTLFCHRGRRCVKATGNDDDIVKYCRECALASGSKFCKGECKKFLCPDCFQEGNYRCCEVCGDNYCSHENCWCELEECRACGRIKCRGCIPYNEQWHSECGYDYPPVYCPDCKEEHATDMYDY